MVYVSLKVLEFFVQKRVRTLKGLLHSFTLSDAVLDFLQLSIEYHTDF